MAFSVLDRPLSLTDQTAGMLDTTLAAAIPGAGIPEHAADAISRLRQQYPQATQGFMQGITSNPLASMFGFIPGGNVLQGILNMLQQLLAGGSDSEQYFQSANGGSVGDPHLSFNGKTWDNMGSQPDLLHSDSFDGGYQLSTQTTPPGSNGVTYNQSATVATNYGNTNVTLDKNGNLSIAQYGDSFSL
ncbi:MAG TPA: hypothetical protein VFN49_10240, partial [Candidatus Aquilonibacter sp.]|nr:hypothetical protein [Candidatus Aquilonibacter sp.]